MGNTYIRRALYYKSFLYLRSILKLTTILSSLDLFIFTEWCKKLGNKTKRPSLGAILNDYTIPMLKCSIIAGASNNQLEKSHEHGKALMSKGILVAPDYVINAGGLINVSNELEGYNKGQEFWLLRGLPNI